MRKGDIVLIPFPFTDLSGNKNRPALVLLNNEIDITVAFISTQIKWKEIHDILISPNKENGLKKDSVIRISKIATLDKELILGKLGKLAESDLKKINTSLKVIFDLN